MRTSSFVAFTLAAVIGFSFAACNCGNGGGGDDGGQDGGEILTDAGCLAQGSTCSLGGTACCGGAVCDQGVCGAPACRNPGETCTAGECCGGRLCVDGVCSSATCSALGSACSSGSECCTLTCGAGADGGNQCLPIPGQGQSCKVQGEPCSAGGECCSTNCQGGVCAPAFSCRAYYDLCTSDGQCCSLTCSGLQADGGGVGTCGRTVGAGGCTGSGNPCSTDTECCTRTCVNPGSGTSICQPTVGCRVQGDTCSDTTSCCGSADQTRPSTCTAENKCDNGTSCRAAGMICGAPTQVLPDGGVACATLPGQPDSGCYRTSQETNCCQSNRLPGNLETYCRLDIGGVPRCFGGNGDVNCPYGYTGVEPCCIAEGSYCEFRDQCCGGRLCTVGSDGGRQCTGATCGTAGTSCTQTGQCCSPLQCLATAEVGMACQNPTQVPDAGCRANDAGCASPGDCCSGICGSGGVCVPLRQCSGAGGPCSATGDCCSNLNLVCDLPAGSTNGTCAVLDAGTGDGGSTCSTLGQSCTGAGQCCASYACVDPNNITCNGTTACSCQAIIN